MKKSKIFIACDTTKKSKIIEIIRNTQNKKLKIGYKFGLEFLNSKNGRSFLKNLKNKITFADLKLHDIPNTCKSTIKAVKDLKVNYLTIHISSGLDALKAAKKVSGKIKLIGEIVKKIFKKEIITPGIRFTKKINDQKRFLTPKKAYANGADWLVIGRDITNGNIKKNTKSLINHLNK